MKTSLNLKTLMGGNFGKQDNLVLTMSGLGFKAKDGDVYVYDKTSKTITKVPSDFVIGDIPVYAIPATDVSLKEGDLIIHNDFLKVFLGQNEDKTFKTINVKTQEVQNLIPTKTLFGFGVFSKVISLFDGFGSAGSPVGADGAINSNAMLMLALMGDKDGDGDEDGGIDPMMLMALSGGLGGNAAGAGGFNPLMLLAFKGKL